MSLILIPRSNINISWYWTTEVYIDTIADLFHKPKNIFTKLVWFFLFLKNSNTSTSPVWKRKEKSNIITKLVYCQNGNTRTLVFSLGITSQKTTTWDILVNGMPWKKIAHFILFHLLIYCHFYFYFPPIITN